MTPARSFLQLSSKDPSILGQISWKFARVPNDSVPSSRNVRRLGIGEFERSRGDTTRVYQKRIARSSESFAGAIAAGWQKGGAQTVLGTSDSPYRTAISGAILKLQEEGKLHVLKTRWWKEKRGGGSCRVSKRHDSFTVRNFHAPDRDSGKERLNF